MTKKDRIVLLEIGQALRLRRKYRERLTQGDVGKKIRRSKPLISKIETGQHPLDFITLAKMASALNFSTEEFSKLCELAYTKMLDNEIRETVKEVRESAKTG